MIHSFCSAVGFATCLFLSIAVGMTFGQRNEEHELEVLSTEDVGAFQPEHVPDLTQVRQLIVEKTNKFRTSKDRSELDRNEELDAAAQDFARYMAETNRYGHTADGRQPSERAQRHGYEFCLIAENIAYQFATESFRTENLAQRTVQGWIDSPGHRRNMLNCSLPAVSSANSNPASTPRPCG